MHFPLHPETPQEGRSLEELFAGRNVDVEAMYTRMKGLMDEEGLPYGKRTHTYNSRLAQELGKWADTQLGGEAIHDALYRAYFVDLVNVGDVEALLTIVDDVGLDIYTARDVLQSRSFSDAVDADWGLSRHYGITGVPTFVAAQKAVVGAQPYEVLKNFLQEAGAETIS